MLMLPESWPETVRFLVEEQQPLERLPVIEGLQTDAEEIDVLCLKYAAKHEWPSQLPARDKAAIVQRFDWARFLAAMLAELSRKADGTETARLQYPDWDFESMMTWLLVETWKTAEKISAVGLLKALSSRQPPQWPPNPEAN